MAFFSLEHIYENLYFVKNSQGKGFVLNLKNKKQLSEELDEILNIPVKNYFIVRKDNKYALFHSKKGIISSWFYRIFPYVDGLNFKLFKMGYLLASDKPKSDKHAIFKFDGTRISDYYSYIIVLKVKKNDILYVAEEECEKQALFSLKSGRLTDWFDMFAYAEICFIKGKGNYFIASKNRRHFLLSKKDYKVILEGAEIEPVFRNFSKNDEVYLVNLNGNEKFLFYRGYCTERYNSILAISEDLLFIAVKKTKDKKEFYLIDLKNKTQRRLPQFLFEGDKIRINVFKNTSLHSPNIRLMLYFPHFYSAHFDYKLAYDIVYCSNCNNTWFLYFEYKNEKICPLCDVSKLEVFFI